MAGNTGGFKKHAGGFDMGLGNLTTDSRKQNVSYGAAQRRRKSTGMRPSTASQGLSKSRLGCSICLRLHVSSRGTAPPAFSHVPSTLPDSAHGRQRRNAEEVGPQSPGTPPVRSSACGFQQEVSLLENSSGSGLTLVFELQAVERGFQLLMFNQ